MPRHSKNVPTVPFNDQVAHGKPPTSAVSGKTFQFEVGNYDQVAAACTPTNATTVAAATGAAATGAAVGGFPP
ncbi:MAG: hypothetical protein ABI488_21800 [Polyangiaceae bacterium]